MTATLPALPTVPAGQSPAGSPTVVLDAALAHYHGELAAALGAVAPTRATDTGFAPAFRLPPLDDALRRFLAPSGCAATDLGHYAGRRLTLLDLMRNPRTKTTKTFGSLVMVARAVEHVRRTGERVMLLTPSSGNKATAVRDAVLRAVESGLVTPDQLSVTTIVPAASTAKLWASSLDADPALRARNPVVVHTGGERDGVKALATRYRERHERTVFARYGARLWYTLDLANYRAADAARYFFERDFMPRPRGHRLHVHAVSSAFGLLGHALGRRLSERAGDGGPAPAYLLVQHLETPDMVLHLHTGSTDRGGLPAYRFDGVSGLYRQSADPRFPAATFDVAEVLEPTFYSHRPATAGEMTALIRGQGGGGIVVSLYECLHRYGEVRALLGPAGVRLPADPRRLREWSLVMALTGALTAVDRGLVPHEDIVVHGSGSYGDDDFAPVPPDRLRPVASPDDLEPVVAAALDAATAEAADAGPPRRRDR